jgi:hypothetical protein
MTAMQTAIRLDADGNAEVRTMICEQVTFVGEAEMIAECDNIVKHKVTWGEKDMHPGEMYMCDQHMRDFLADAEWCEGITWTYVHEV